MPANRSFSFPISVLLRDAKRLHAALVDPVTGPAVARRLAKKNPVAGQPDIVFAPLFDAHIQIVENGGIAKSCAVGEIGQMTQEQIEAFAEMERLISGARRSATLAFLGNYVRLRSEFQIGIHEPADFASEIERAGKVHAACIAHPTARAAKDEATLVARNRFLLDEFPPRDREKSEATTPLPTPLTP